MINLVLSTSDFLSGRIFLMSLHSPHYCPICCFKSQSWWSILLFKTLWGFVCIVDSTRSLLQACRSVAKSCPTLCNPMNCSMPGFPVLHYLPEFAQTHVRWGGCHPTVSSSAIHFSSCPQSFPTSGSFPVSQLFTAGGQSIGASASVLLMNIQGWFPLGLIGLISFPWRLTGWISLQSKGLSRVFSNTTVQKHQFSDAQPSLWSLPHIRTCYWKNHSFDYTDLCWQSDLCFLILCLGLS